MPVHQVEEYYIYIDFGRPLNEEAEEELSEVITEAGYEEFRFEFRDNRSALVVDGILSEYDGEELEEKINEYLGV